MTFFKSGVLQTACTLSPYNLIHSTELTTQILPAHTWDQKRLLSASEMLSCICERLCCPGHRARSSADVARKPGGPSRVLRSPLSLALTQPICTGRAGTSHRSPGWPGLGASALPLASSARPMRPEGRLLLLLLLVIISFTWKYKVMNLTY